MTLDISPPFGFLPFAKKARALDTLEQASHHTLRGLITAPGLGKGLPLASAATNLLWERVCGPGLGAAAGAKARGANRLGKSGRPTGNAKGRATAGAGKAT